MQLETVASSMVHAIGYDADTRVLEIIMYPGRIYQYGDVPREVYDNFLKAESPGRFFGEHIRERYKFWTVEQSPYPDTRDE